VDVHTNGNTTLLRFWSHSYCDYDESYKVITFVLFSFCYYIWRYTDDDCVYFFDFSLFLSPSLVVLRALMCNSFHHGLGVRTLCMLTLIVCVHQNIEFQFTSTNTV